MELKEAVEQDRRAGPVTEEGDGALALDLLFEDLGEEDPGGFGFVLVG